MILKLAIFLTLNQLNKIMEQQFILYLQQSDKLRSGYYTSLLPIYNNWEVKLKEVMNEIPELFKIIYSRISGTKYEINNQIFMDFVPGFLLIHILEYHQNYLDLNKITKDSETKGIFYPIVRNYSSDFIAMDKDLNKIYLIYHDDPQIYLIHNDANKFLETLNENYKQNVYFLDQDGYLDYDQELEYKVAKEINKNIEFWVE